MTAPPLAGPVRCQPRGTGWCGYCWCAAAHVPLLGTSTGISKYVKKVIFFVECKKVIQINWPSTVTRLCYNINGYTYYYNTMKMITWLSSGVTASSRLSSTNSTGGTSGLRKSNKLASRDITCCKKGCIGWQHAYIFNSFAYQNVL